MKRLGVIGLVLIGWSAAAQADDIVIAADPWCPYNCAPESDRPGYMVEIAAKAFSGAGHKLTYKTTPWARALAEVNSGKIAGVFGASPEEAKDLIYPKQPFGQSRNALVVPSASPFVWRSIESLDPIALGIIQDYSYGEPLDSYIKAHTGNPSRIQSIGGDAPLQANLRKLIAGRIGATVDDANVLAYTIANGKLTDALRLVEPGDTPSPLFIGFSPKIAKAADYAALLDRTLQDLRASGELTKILARYNLHDWGKPGI